ncbi:MAG: hypothetical protein Rubg2KO_18280 [Rubricoccaceae bacterium]
MTRLLSLLFALILGLAMSSSASAQLTPQQAVAEMGRGINLGNTLEPPTESAWNNGPAQATYFDAYKAAGFTSVRVPVRWDEHTASTPPYSIDAGWMTRVEEVVDWGLDRDLYIVLNAHHEDWIKQGYSDPTLRARFDSIWVQVAERFKDKSEKLLFEIINEPFGMTVEEVDDMNARILSIIRKENPTRLVVFSGNEYSNIPQLLAAAIPDDPYLIGYFHSYDPWRFAGQSQGTWGSAAERAEVRQRFGQVEAWSNTHNIPVMLSEFGAMRNADEMSRQVFYATYVEEALRAGFAFHVWDDGGDFRLLNRQNNTWPEEVDLLTHAVPDGPTDLRATADRPVALAWTLRSASDSVLVQRRRPGEPYTYVARLAGDASSYIDSTTIGGQTYQYRILTRTAGQNDAPSYPIEVTARPSRRAPFGGSPSPIPGTIQAEDFDEGGEDLTYHDTTPDNIPGAYRSNVAVDIEPRDDGGFQITGVTSGEWLEYTVDVAETGTYEASIYVAAELGGGRLRLSVGGLNGDLLRTPTTGSGQTLEPVVTTLPLEAGEQILRLNLLTARPYNVDRIAFKLVGGTAEEPGVSEGAFRIYPNPATEFVTIEMDGLPGDGAIEVFNVLGQRVRALELASGVVPQVRVADLAPGTYLLRATVEQRVIGQDVFIKP